MQTLSVSFSDTDTTLDRLTDLAEELGVAPEDLAIRAIGAYLAGYGLHDVPSSMRPGTLKELFEARGLLTSGPSAQDSDVRDDEIE